MWPISPEGVHLTLFSEDPKIREALAVELTADRFVSRNKLKKASRVQKKAGGKDGKEIKIIIKSTAASGRFTRKEMEGLCNGGNTSIARVKRVLLEIANRLEINVEGIDMEEDLNSLRRLRITMEAASPSSQEDMQLVSELSAVIEDAASLKLVLDKAVGNLHDTFYSPGSLEFMSLGEWAKMPEEQGVGRNVLKEKLGK
ncbi:hypothetical protein GUITHDRAFT_106486 [Guillardia theta CCMP2712]|uniref:Uncharacterized protein n=1 Tax=Guillardia theta (strain CCMP2712) TaxID=905079 RepID=L1JIL9_GUITC|nr:hypothetical protein GUITHDRAFT_106486 [Guillardia theta CCMP2712]EKX47940.1 hypothetical protein GUITHDRAFT_106486 [Guillardia theta CCMP2712]|eukprot:XP_005834920.1 hypothetical protein GUITHDRAFT_106486 [Guillardia theta CCMP2712]